MGLIDKLFRRKDAQKQIGDAPIFRHFDLRSDEFKKMEAEVALGLSSDSSQFEDLSDLLVEVVQESHEWALANGFPVIEDYPQYQRIRELGEQIHEVAGFQGMQRACAILKARCHTSSGGAKSFPAEIAWRGIGGWIP